MTTEVRDNPDLHRYELFVGTDLVGVADYQRRGDIVVLPHTVIEPGHRGKGYAAVLVRGALDDLRRQAVRVDPQCWYVAAFIDDHATYHDLRA
jgi:predicted GNAT family acetyltransferase